MAYLVEAGLVLGGGYKLSANVESTQMRALDTVTEVIDLARAHGEE